MFTLISELENFLLEDIQGYSELLLSWLYCQYAVKHDFSFLSKMLTGTVDRKPTLRSYDDILHSIIEKILSHTPNRDRDE